jgi:hypothetical protein
VCSFAARLRLRLRLGNGAVVRKQTLVGDGRDTGACACGEGVMASDLYLCV